MYGWERRNGTLADLFAESITDDDVVKILELTRRALVPDAKPNESEGTESVDPSEVNPDATPSDIAPDDDGFAPKTPVSSDTEATNETSWLELKHQGTEAFSRGAFAEAADRFAVAIATFSDSNQKHEKHDDANVLAGLHSNRSAALLRGGDSKAALQAAERCVQLKPTWDKGQFRVGEALFASRRFAEAEKAYAKAIEFETTTGTHCAQIKNTAHCITSKPTRSHSLLEVRLEAATRAAQDAAALDSEETSLRLAREKAQAEREGKKEATSDENINKLNAEAEDRERDPRARQLMNEIEKLFKDARENFEEQGKKEVRDVDDEEIKNGSEETKDVHKNVLQKTKSKGPDVHVALSLLDQLLQIEPENADAAFQAAILSLRDGRVIDAIKYGRQCVDRAPGFARGADLLATCLEMTQEGGDRARGDAAVAARVVAPPADDNPSQAQQVTPSPSESEAEMALTITVASNPDSPDCWTSFARHLARRGFVTDAVAALRAAIAGGPEAKWLKPRADPGVMVTLGYLMHIRGHVAEPASLYTGALSLGGGFIAATLLSRVQLEMGDEDESVRVAKHLAARDAFAKHPKELAGQIEALNVSFQAPQFEIAARKHVMAEMLSDAGCVDVAPQTLSFSEKDENDWENNSSWMLKAFRRAFEGDSSAQRVFNNVSSTTQVLDALNIANLSPETATMQRYVSKNSPKTKHGQSVSLRFFAEVVGDENEKSKLTWSVSDGFVIRAAAPVLFEINSRLDQPEDDFMVDISDPRDAAAWSKTNSFGVRSDAGDETATDIDPVDWSVARDVAHRKADTYFSLATKVWQTKVGEFDAQTHWRRVQLPKLLELTFVLDEHHEPWLVDVDPHPSLSKYAQNTENDDVGVALDFAARAYDLVE